MISRGHVLVFVAVGLAQGAEPKTVDPEVRMVVTEQKYCLGQPGFVSIEKQPPDAITLRVHSRLSYRNSGSKPVILPVEEDAVLILSRSLEDVARRKNQLALRFYKKRPRDLAEHGINLDRPAEPFFMIVPPGEESKFGFSQNVVLRVHNPSESRPESEWLGKKVFLQLELEHLPFSKRFAQHLAAKWSEYGDLWTGKVRTEPLEVDIPASPKFGDCSLEYRID